MWREILKFKTDFKNLNLNKFTKIHFIVTVLSHTEIYTRDNEWWLETFLKWQLLTSDITNCKLFRDFRGIQNREPKSYKCSAYFITVRLWSCSTCCWMPWRNRWGSRRKKVYSWMYIWGWWVPWCGSHTIARWCSRPLLNWAKEHKESRMWCGICLKEWHICLHFNSLQYWWNFFYWW